MEYVYLQALILPCSSASVCEFILLNGRGTTTGIPEYGALMGLKTYFGNCSTNILSAGAHRSASPVPLEWMSGSTEGETPAHRIEKTAGALAPAV